MSNNDMFYCTTFNQSVVSRGAKVSCKGTYVLYISLQHCHVFKCKIFVYIISYSTFYNGTSQKNG